MKKTALLAVALATCLGYAPARAADVVSSNIVGYEKITLNEGFNMLGTQFVKVGGGALGLSTVGELDKTMLGPDEEGFFTTTMRVWNGNGYDTYGWSGTAGTDALDDESLNYKWLNNDMEEPTDPAPVGFAFWVKTSEADGTMTISGEVPSEASVTIDLVEGFNMVANPYPGTVKVSEFGQLAATMSGPDEEGFFTTTMRVWNGNGYDTYGWSGTAGSDALDDETLNYKWLNNDMEETDDTITFGHAVWIKAGENGSITFASPL